MLRSILFVAALTSGIALGTAPLTGGAGRAPATISGRVSSDSGVALRSASVFIVGMHVGTLTGDDGRYSFTVPESLARGQRVTVTARLIGFHAASREMRLRAGARDTLNFTLATDRVRLSEVVVTGGGRAENEPALDAAAGSPSGAISSERVGSPSMLPFAQRSAAAPLPNAPMVTGVSTADMATADQLVIVSRGDAAERRLGSAMAPAAAKSMATQWPDGAIGSLRYEMARRAALHTRATEVGPRPTQGTLRARTGDGEILGEFPLQHTAVNAEISAYLARTTVEQRYANPYSKVIEAVYVFPLPAMAAVNDFVMEVGGRKIVGVVRSRAEAERIYQDALMRGQTASLLTQERPNIFTQSVANIEPGATVAIRITYFERLAYEDGGYEYVFPMVVGPRYIPGNSQPGATLASNSGTRPPPSDGGGWSPNTDIVPDASHITPPVLKPGQRSGADISLTVTVDAGLPITHISSVAHQVEIERPSATRDIVRLAAADNIPNRDFVLRWQVAGAETQFGVLAHRDRHGGYFTLTMQPPAAPRDDQVTPREITFIMDISGSMMGLPIETSKELVRRTLDELRPDDRFNIVYFASGNAQLWEEAHPRTPENIAAAKKFLETLSGGGGTEMLAGVERALHAKHDSRYLQMFVFATDGYIGDEERILRTIKTERGHARFFGFGIGSSVNRYLIEQIGAEGAGQSFTIIPRDSAGVDSAVSRLFAAIDSPVLVDVGIDWNGLPVADVFPSKPRDLFAGQTIDVIGRYTHAATGTVYVTGRIGSRKVRYPVPVALPENEPEHAALAPTWARWRIAELSSAMLTAPDSAARARLEQEITQLAIEHRLVSQYTAFVAVDESRIVGDGHPVRVLQPVELPEGVSWEGIFGEAPVGLPMRIGAWGLDVQETASGHVRVGAVDRSGAAARSGVPRGAVLERVNGTTVTDAASLERVLLQSGGTVTLELQPGGKRTLPAP